MAEKIIPFKTVSPSLGSDENWVDVHKGRGMIDGVEITRNPHMPNLWGFQSPDKTGTISVMFTDVSEHSNPTIVRHRMQARIYDVFHPEEDCSPSA